ncbi:MAG: glycosyltransferase family 2 protein [Gammaproteobacteria bacterium]
MDKCSIIIPARNEALTLGGLLQSLCRLHPGAEIIVVNDGSVDDTAGVAAESGARVISSPYPMGNGAAVKAGAREAGGDIFVFMDADGQHAADEVSKLLNVMDEGYDMVIGARSVKAHASKARYLANLFYNWFASWVSGHRVLDLTSGLRAVRAEKFREFLYMLPNGFSYPTTITMAMFRAGYRIAYVPVQVGMREGNSHIRPFYDGLRFLLIIFKVGTLYTPLKLFFPISAFFFMTGLGYYLYTFIAYSRFTNMSVLLFITAIIIFLIGLISEQLTVLLYSSSRHHRNGKWKPEQ